MNRLSAVLLLFFVTAAHADNNACGDTTEECANSDSMLATRTALNKKIMSKGDHEDSVASEVSVAGKVDETTEGDKPWKAKKAAKRAARKAKKAKKAAKRRAKKAKRRAKKAKRVRQFSLQFKAEKVAEAKILTADIEKDVSGGAIKGYEAGYSFWKDDTTYVALQVFKTSEDLAQYGADLKKKYLSRLGPVLQMPNPYPYNDDGAPSLIYTDKLTSGNAGAVMRQFALEFVPGKLEDGKTIMKVIEAEVEEGKIPGLLSSFGFWKDNVYKNTGIYKDQNSLDDYKASMKAQYLAQLKPMLDPTKNPYPYDDAGTVHWCFPEAQDQADSYAAATEAPDSYAAATEAPDSYAAATEAPDSEAPDSYAAATEAPDSYAAATEGPDYR
jgi:hypothetical protein